jgi:protein phosphatase
VAVEALRASFESNPTVEGLIEAVREANRAVWERADEQPDLRGMGTTMTALALVDDEGEEVLVLVHVGDSRAYLRRAGALRRLTRDQTLAASLVAAQAMSERQAQEAGYHKVLASAVGARDLSPAVRVLGLEPGDVLLLCTDGLTKAASEGEIAAVLDRPADPEARCRELVALALERGGGDNITAIVVQTLPPDVRRA